LARVKDQLTSNADSLNTFKKEKGIFDLNFESERISSKIEQFKNEKEDLLESKVSYDILKNYLLTSDDFTEFPAPALSGVTEKNVSTNVSRIIALSVEKSNLQKSLKSGAAVFDDYDRQINAIKSVLLENISSVKATIDVQIASLNRRKKSFRREICRITRKSAET
jgi:hypothetical protein